MSSNDLTLGSIATIIDCEHKTAPETENEIYAFSVGTRALTNNTIDVNSCKPVDEQTYKLWSRRGEVEEGDLILASEAPVGGFGLVKSLSPIYCLGQRTVLIKPKTDVVNSYYLNYLLQSDAVQGWFTDMSTGSTVLHLNVGDIKKLPIPNLPSMQQQQRIAEILNNLEAKINLNKTIAGSLEDMAQEIFKSWFIDFEPVKAKMAGEKPAGMDDETAALFPDSMEESELGLIPKGWSVSKLEKHIKVTKGKSYKSSELEPSKTALVTLKSFKRGGGYRFDGLKPFSGQYKPEQVVEPGELVVSFTDVTQAADVIGKPAIVFQDPRFSTLVASLDVGIVRTIGNQFSKNYLYQLFLTPEFKNHTDGYTNGTTVLHLGKGALENYLVVSPGEKLMSKYDDIAGAFQSQMQLYQLENLALKEIRDSLLPRLISGELEIPKNAWEF